MVKQVAFCRESGELKSRAVLSGGCGGVSPPKVVRGGSDFGGNLHFFSNQAKYLFSIKKITKFFWIIANFSLLSS